MPFAVTKNAFAFGRQCAAIGWGWDDALTTLRLSDVQDRHDERSFAAGYGRAVHFVGFRGDEYTNAVRVFGRPDLIHRQNDPRFLLGGELSPVDLVVYANGSEGKPTSFSFDDSAVF